MFTYSSTPYKAGAPFSDLSVALSQIPLGVWEGSTPVLDVAIRETTRLAQPHTAMRKNMGPDVHIDGKLVPSGHYVVYPFSDVHLNEELYPDPWKFDPGRPRPDGRYSYLGWGDGMALGIFSQATDQRVCNFTGTITCLGQRLAKVKTKMMSAVFLLGTDFRVVDRAGEPLATLPRPNWNEVLGCQHPKDPYFIQYEVHS